MADRIVRSAIPLTTQLLSCQIPSKSPKNVEAAARREHKCRAEHYCLPATFQTTPASLSAEAHAADTLFAIGSDQLIYEHSPSGNRQISTILKAKQLSASQTLGGKDQLFATLIDGSLFEFSSGPGGSGFEEVAGSGIAQVSAP